MGIDRHGLAAIIMTDAKKPLGKTLTLGRQGLHNVQGEITRLFGDSSQEAASDSYCEMLLLNHLHASSVKSIDMTRYEGATHTHDMNLPVPDSLRSEFDSVLDLGTLEHIFNVHQALVNVSSFVRVGGQILHVLPADNFCGHGFWQFSPELFLNLYSSENGYSETEVFLADLSIPSEWFKVLPLHNGERLRLHTTSPTYVIVRTVKIREDDKSPNVNQNDYELAWADNLQDEVNRGGRGRLEFGMSKSFSSIVELLKKFWLFELMVVTPYRQYLNRRIGLSPKNSQLKGMRVGGGPKSLPKP